MEKPVSFKSFVVFAALVCGFAAVGFAASHPGERPPIGLTVGSDPMAILPSDNGVPFLPPNQWVTYAPSVGMKLLLR